MTQDRPGRPLRGILLALLLAAGLACNLTPMAVPPTPQPPTSPPAAPPPTPTSTPLPADSGWQALAAGFEGRTLRLTNEGGELIETVTLLRIDPHQVRFAVSYAPDAPRTVDQWASELGAAVVLNAGYFTPEYQATGLLVADGLRYGSSYGDFAGMLAVTGDRVELRWLAESPYDPAEPLDAAVQSFPLLIKPGGMLGYPEEDGMPARRTVLGQDRSGRLLIIISPNGSFTLHSLALYLLESDLGLDIALNLDGGTSTGMVANLGGSAITIPGLAAVPAVIAIYPHSP